MKMILMDRTYTVEYCPNKSCDIATFLIAKTDLKTIVISNLTYKETYKFTVYSMASLKNVSNGILQIKRFYLQVWNIPN